MSTQDNEHKDREEADKALNSISIQLTELKNSRLALEKEQQQLDKAMKEMHINYNSLEQSKIEYTKLLKEGQALYQKMSDNLREDRDEMVSFIGFMKLESENLNQKKIQTTKIYRYASIYMILFAPLFLVFYYFLENISAVDELHEVKVAAIERGDYGKKYDKDVPNHCQSILRIQHDLNLFIKKNFSIGEEIKNELEKNYCPKTYETYEKMQRE